MAVVGKCRHWQYIFLATLVLLLVVVVGEEQVQSAPVVRDYGEPCTCDTDCDFSKWLNCHHSICACLSKTFQYDFERHTCVVKLGHKCFEVAADYSQYKDLPPFIRCVEGAFCSISAGGLCACNTYGYFESSDGIRCERKKELGGSCVTNAECKTDACEGGSCVCKQGQYYDPKRDKCLGLVGTYCFTDDECTENSICNGYQGARCSCAKGYRDTESRYCTKEQLHGDSCDSSTPCNNVQLACIRGSCQCAYPDHQQLDEGSKRCRSLVASAPCNGDDGCVANARCTVSPDGSFNECQCNSGYVELEDGTCGQFSSFGVSCENDEECDPVIPLICKESKCQCRDSLSIFDPLKRICRGLHGFRGCQGKDSLCVQNAHCVQWNSKLPPKCVCRPMHTPGANRTCHLTTATSLRDPYY